MGLVEEGEGTTTTTIKFYRHKGHRFWKRQAGEILELVREFSLLGRAIGHHAEMMFEAALGSAGFRTVARNARSYGDKKWTKTGHDLDRIWERDGVGYGSELKNTLKYIVGDEFEAKLAMCEKLGLRPLFVMRMLPKSYVHEVNEAGGYALLFGERYYPFGHENLVQRVRGRLELPVGSPKTVPDGLVRNFERWHQRVVKK